MIAITGPISRRTRSDRAAICPDAPVETARPVWDITS
jgi:hypothetical protein